MSRFAARSPRGALAPAQTQREQGSQRPTASPTIEPPVPSQSAHEASADTSPAQRYPFLAAAAAQLFGEDLFASPASSGFLGLAAGWGVGAASADPNAGGPRAAGSLLSALDPRALLGTYLEKGGGAAPSPTGATATHATEVDGFGLWGATRSEHKRGAAPSETSSTTWSLPEGRVGHSETASTSSREADGSEEEIRDDASLQQSVGGGVQVGASLANTRRRTDADGQTHQTRTEVSAAGGLTLNDGAAGLSGTLGGGYASGSTQVAGQAGGGAELGADRLGAHAKGGAKLGLGPVSGSVSLQGGAGASQSLVDVGEGDARHTIYGERYQLSAGGSLGGELGGDAWSWLPEPLATLLGGASPSVGASADAGATLSYRQRLDAEDQQLRDRKGDDAFKKLHALTGVDRSGAEAVLGGEGAAEAAAGLDVGCGWSLEGQAQLRGEAGLAVAGVGVTGERGKQWKRTFDVDKEVDDAGREQVLLRVAFEEVDTSATGAALSWLGVKTSLNWGQLEGAGRALNAQVSPDDPAYRAVFAAISGAQGPDDLDGIEVDPALQGYLGARTDSRRRGREEHAKGGVLRVDKARALEASTTVGAEGVSSEGRADATVGIALGGREFASQGVRAEATTEGDGAAIQTSTSSSGLGLRGLWDVMQRLGELDAWELIEQGVPTALADALTEPVTEVDDTLGFDAADIAVLTARADQTEYWGWCAIGDEADRRAWEALRLSLLSPSPAPEAQAKDPEAAALAARCQALLTFYTEASNPERILGHMRKDWGVGPGSGAAYTEDTATGQLGRKLSFASIEDDAARRATEQAWKAATLAAPGVRAAIEEARSAGTSPGEAPQAVTDFLRTVDEISRTIAESRPSDPEAYTDMRARLAAWEALGLAARGVWGKAIQHQGAQDPVAHAHAWLADCLDAVTAALEPYAHMTRADKNTFGFLHPRWVPIGETLKATVSRWESARSHTFSAYGEAKTAPEQRQVSLDDVTRLPLDLDWDAIARARAHYPS